MSGDAHRVVFRCRLMREFPKMLFPRLLVSRQHLFKQRNNSNILLIISQIFHQFVRFHFISTETTWTNSIMVAVVTQQVSHEVTQLFKIKARPASSTCSITAVVIIIMCWKHLTFLLFIFIYFFRLIRIQPFRNFSKTKIFVAVDSVTNSLVSFLTLKVLNVLKVWGLRNKVVANGKPDLYTKI